MTYVLREGIYNRYYCKDHNKIIEFDTIEEAHNFLNHFAQVASALAMSQIMTNPGIMNEVQQAIQSTKIDEKPKTGTCEYINYKEISGR
jgi:hypothetical protein